MAAYRNRAERAYISAIQVADGRVKYLPEEGYPSGGKTANILRFRRGSEMAVMLDFIDVLACYFIENMI